MALVISGTDLSVELKDKMKEEVLLLQEKYNSIPHLVVVYSGFSLPFGSASPV